MERKVSLPSNAASSKQKKRSAIIIVSLALVMAVLIIAPQLVFAASTYTLSNSNFSIKIGQYGEINSLKIVNDAFPTDYVMNPENSPNQNTADHYWMGELMFKYKLEGDGSYSTALTNKSDDVRIIKQDGTGVTVKYSNSSNAQGIRNFDLTEKYWLTDDAFNWSITVKNTTNKNLEIGDFGLPLPFNERWPSGEIYETQVLKHSFVGNDGSYIYATRPSGIGKMLLMTPDSSVAGSGFEYMDHWRSQEHPGSMWVQDAGGWANGLNVYYIHSNVIKSTNRGYLPNTSLVLAPGQSKTYAFKFFVVEDQTAMQNKLYDAGLIDVVAVPGMMFATDMKAKVDLHTSQTIDSIDVPTGAAMKLIETKNLPDGIHNIYSLSLSQLGQNDVTVHYGGGKKTTLQFYAIEPVADALQRHATFMVEKTQYNDDTLPWNKIFDDWMMDTKSKRGSFNRYGGWGDDWGWTHAEFLAEKNVISPVASEIKAVDDYLEIAVWNQIMKDHHTDYLVNDWFITTNTGSNNFGRGYAYPHIYNTYFSMYKTAKLHPNAITYAHPAKVYLERAYGIFKALYDGPVGYNWSTGLMGEQTTPDIIQALKDEGMTAEANDIIAKMAVKYNNFKNTKYPYGSEYNYDNTGEESVYMLAKMNGNKEMMKKINDKTRACRGTQPLWYYYADPTTICGEAWWNFQYTVSLAGYCMDDYLKTYSTQPEIDERLSYAAKIANLGCINSGQIDSDPENIGTVAWTYQSEKGNIYGNSFDPANSKLHNGWRQMSGEADLGLFGALRILSSDVTDDPVFGTFGYGCDLAVNGDNYEIVPRDGVNQRLNLISKGIYFKLEQDQYTKATIDVNNKNRMTFQLKNVDKAAHIAKATVKGLAPGTYNIIINHELLGSFHQIAGKEAVAKLRLDGTEINTVEFIPGVDLPNQAPVVDAGGDFTVTLPEAIKLEGSVTDDGYGSPEGALATTWSAISMPEGASVIFTTTSALTTTVTVTTPGSYEFRLEASDGLLSSDDTVKVIVLPAPTVPELIADYRFDAADNGLVSDSTGNSSPAALKGGASLTAAPEENANVTGSILVLNGSSQYALLPEGILKNVHDFTISTWVYVDSANSWERIWDFGTGTGKYMFLAPNSGGAGLRFAITTSGGGGEQIITTSRLTTGTWHNVAVTLYGNVGILYVDGKEAARNSNITLTPADLGNTANNYIGKSQYSDPYLKGKIDNFKIYSRALTANEIAVAAGAQPANAIISITTPGGVTTKINVAPVLPSTVLATFDNGAKMPVNVTWDSVPPSSYSAVGTFEVNGTVDGTGIAVKITVTVINAIEEIINPDPVVTPAGKSPVTLFPQKVPVILSDGSTTEVAVTWSIPAASVYAIENATPVTVNGSVDGTQKQAQISFTVSAAKPMKVPDIYATTKENVAPVLPATIDAVFTDASVKTVNLDYGTIDPSVYAAQGTTTFAGAVADYPDPVIVHLTVLKADASLEAFEPVFIETEESVAPVLPKEISATYTDGSSATLPIVWEEIPVLSYMNTGTFTVNGTVTGALSEGKTTKIYAVVTVKPAHLVSVNPVYVSTTLGSAPAMPSVVKGKYSNGTVRDTNVTWNMDPSKYSLTTYTLTGSVTGTDVTVTAYVGVPNKSLGFWYKLDETDGTTINDSSFNGSTGTLYGTPLDRVGGQYGNALTFKNNYITVPYNSNMLTKSFTFTVWIKRTTNMSGEQILWWDKASGDWAGRGVFINVNGGINAYLDNMATISYAGSANTIFPLNTWTHVAVVWDDAAKKGYIYINGQKKTEVSLPNATYTAYKNTTWIGYNSPAFGGSYFNQTMDDIRFYTAALTAEEIQALYNNSPKITGFTPVSVSTNIGVQPVLPAKVTAIYLDGTTQDMDVAWAAIDASQLAQAGTFTVDGAVTGSAITAKATVLVKSDKALKITTNGALAKTSGTITATYSVNPSEGVAYGGNAYLVVEVRNGDEPVSISSFKIDPTVTLNRTDKFYVGSDNSEYNVVISAYDQDPLNSALTPKIIGDQVVIR